MREGNVAPSGINVAIAAIAVAGGALLPGMFGMPAGRLPAMQFLVVHAIMPLYVVICFRNTRFHPVFLLPPI